MKVDLVHEVLCMLEFVMSGSQVVYVDVEVNEQATTTNPLGDIHQR